MDTGTCRYLVVLPVGYLRYSQWVGAPPASVHKYGTGTCTRTVVLRAHLEELSVVRTGGYRTGTSVAYGTGTGVHVQKLLASQLQWLLAFFGVGEEENAA
jgi:hypothetical protein